MKNPLQLIERKSWVRILWAVFLLLLFVLLLTILIITIRYNFASKDQDGFEADQDLLFSEDLSMDDFYLDDQNPREGVTYPLYQRQRYWSDEDVESYWIDPGTAALEQLPDRNDKLILESMGAEPR